MSHDNGGRATGVFGLILFAGLIGGLRAIWKNKKDDDNNKDNTSVSL